MKLSSLIYAALRDLKKCEADPNYEVDMNIWHRPVGKVCKVCLAGAYMAQTLKEGQKEVSYPNRYQKQWAELVQLSDITFGFFANVDPEYKSNYMISYSEDRKEWEREIRKFAQFLRKKGK